MEEDKNKQIEVNTNRLRDVVAFRLGLPLVYMVSLIIGMIAVSLANKYIPDNQFLEMYGDKIIIFIPLIACVLFFVRYYINSAKGTSINFQALVPPLESVQPQKEEQITASVIFTDIVLGLASFFLLRLLSSVFTDIIEWGNPNVDYGSGVSYVLALAVALFFFKSAYKNFVIYKKQKSVSSDHEVK